MRFNHVLALALLGFATASEPEYLLQPKKTLGPKVIRGLLGARQGSSGCDVGYSSCDATTCCPTGDVCCTNGCCQPNTYCDTINGVEGCCDLGKICTGTPSGGCTNSGYSPCANDTFCCPTGDSCYRDSTGAASCLPAGGGGGGGGSAVFSSTPNPVMSSTNAGGNFPPNTNFQSTSSPLVNFNTPSSLPTTTTGSSGKGNGILPNSAARFSQASTGFAVLPILIFASAFFL